jgi:hypothetical protein
VATNNDTHSGTPREVAPGLFMYLPTAWTVPDVEIEGSLYDVEMTLDLTAEGVRPTSVTVTAHEGSPPVSGTTLRALRVWDMARDGILAGVNRGSSSTSHGVTRWAMTLADTTPGLSDDEVARLRLQGPTDETLGWVAYFYNLAGVLGMPPARFVEVNLVVPRTTASKWVRRAREKGLISG